MMKIDRLLSSVIRDFAKYDGWALASHIALSILMSLFPFLIFATSLAGFLGLGARAEDMVGIVFEAWPRVVAAPIAHEVDMVLARPSVGFLTLGVTLTLFFASSGVEAVRVALNRAYRAQEDRSFFFCRTQSLLFIILGTFVLLVISLLLVLVPLFAAVVEKAVPLAKEYATPFWLLRYSLAIIALAFALFACHAWLPAGTRSISELWPGVLATLVVWISAARLFTEYITKFADYGATFAGLAGTMTALIFLYLMAVILILGAELNATILTFRRTAVVDTSEENEEFL